MNRFKIGDTYTSSGIYGSKSTYEVVGRDLDDSLTMKVSHVSEDFEIEVQDGYVPMKIRQGLDTELVVLWHFNDERGIIYARP